MASRRPNPLASRRATGKRNTLPRMAGRAGAAIKDRNATPTNKGRGTPKNRIGG